MVWLSDRLERLLVTFNWGIKRSTGAARGDTPGKCLIYVRLRIQVSEPVLPVQPADAQYLHVERARNAASPTDWPKLACRWAASVFWFRW